MSADVHPVQKPRNREQAFAPTSMTMAAYEVYCHIYGPQEALVTGGCRGGFACSELLAFLYARSFPQAEWRKRVDEAFSGMKGLDQ